MLTPNEEQRIWGDESLCAPRVEVEQVEQDWKNRPKKKPQKVIHASDPAREVQNGFMYALAIVFVIAVVAGLAGWL